MGRTFQFDCPLCQYRTRVSGGTDAGINCSIQTIICHDCRELYDVFTKVRRLTGTTAWFYAGPVDSASVPAGRFNEGGNHPVEESGSGAVVFLGTIKTGMPRFRRPSGGGLERSRSLPALRLLSGKNGFPFPALGIIQQPTPAKAA